MEEILPKPISIDYGNQHDVLLYEYLYKRWKENSSTYKESILLVNSRDELMSFLNDHDINSDCDKILYTREEYIVIETNNDLFFIISKNSIFLQVIVYGDQHNLKDIINLLQDNMKVTKSSIEWVFDGYGDHIKIPITDERLPLEEMYPFLQGSLEDYYNSYLESKSNILLLIGPPGTGKTSFIRGLIKHSGKTATLTYDPDILRKDYFFSSFLSGDNTFLILEDSDEFLLPRSEHNSMMHKFLNLGDGLISTNKKKLIFSTNLPSIKDIDSALIRPGRCFDVLHFNKLNLEQANVLAKRSNIDFDPKNKSEFTIAEIYNPDYNSKPPEKKSIGFC